MSTHRIRHRPLIDLINALPGVTDLDLSSVKHGMILATLPGFYLRTHAAEQWTIWAGGRELKHFIELAERKTFDRWANSSNFVTHAIYTKDNRHWSLPDLAAQVRWARKVCRSRVFDFNSYFESVHLP